MYKARIRQLEESYNNLTAKITTAETSDTVDSQILNELRSQLQVVLSDLSKLRKLQWEYDHETIHMDDDR